MILSEGLIKVPPKMLNQMMFYVKYLTLWWARDNMTKDTPKEVKIAWKVQVAELGEEIPAEKFVPEKNMNIFYIPVRLDGMGTSYESMTPSVRSMPFVLHWKKDETKVAGYYQPEKKYIVVYPLSYSYISNLSSGRSHPEDLVCFFRDMEEVLVHELRHFIQDVLLQHPAQSARKRDYSDNGADYWTSPVEFDPMIGSAVHEFMREWDLHVEYGRTPPLSKAIKTFTGMRKGSLTDNFSANKLFKHLRASSPVRYKVAVKKFVLEIEKELEKRRQPVSESIDPEYSKFWLNYKTGQIIWLDKDDHHANTATHDATLRPLIRPAIDNHHFKGALARFRENDLDQEYLRMSDEISEDLSRHGWVRGAYTNKGLNLECWTGSTDFAWVRACLKAFPAEPTWVYADTFGADGMHKYLSLKNHEIDAFTKGRKPR